MVEYRVVSKQAALADYNDPEEQVVDIPSEARGLNTTVIASSPSIIEVSYVVPVDSRE